MYVDFVLTFDCRNVAFTPVHGDFTQIGGLNFVHNGFGMISHGGDVQN
jgi:hypothetical protein